MTGLVFLGFEEVVAVHCDQIERYGGSPGIRDTELLKSAVAMPVAGTGEGYLHAGILEMAAAYLFHIVRNHPFIDGNKRTGAASALVFLLMNGFELNADEEGFERMVRSVAQGSLDKKGVSDFFYNHAGKETKQDPET